MAEAAVSFAVETLGNLLIKKAVFLKGVTEEVEWLRDELKRMQCFLRDATKKQTDSDSIRNWISDIRKVAHDAEDAIEMFVLNVQTRRPLRKYTCFPGHLNHLNKIGKQIESIRRRLKDIDDSRRVYGIQDLGKHQRVESRSQLQEVESRRRINYWKNNQQVVGLEEDVKVILREAIFEKSEGLSVVGILGMGGIGKSTLASKIYNHREVTNRFDFRAWVVVSSEFKPKDIMKQILVKLEISHDRLKLLESAEDNLSCIDNLKEELQKCLAGKRCFIVLDDVWEATHWEFLSNTFSDEDYGSILLLTSRNQVITMKSGYVHCMKILDDNQSQELFLREVFGGANIDRYTQELKNIGEEILKKCGGLPLAISVVGGLLAKKEKCKSEWEKVLREMKQHLDRGGEINAISAVLELSYQNLPPPLRACFLFLGFFEEDATIDSKDLIHIWVAQGLVHQEVVGESEKMEDVAKEYLNELISRNMVQVTKMSRKDGRVKACRMHDFLRELSIEKAKEEIDFEIVREVGSSHQTLDKPRHCVVYGEEAHIVLPTGRNKYLRSFIFYSTDMSYKDEWRSSYWKSYELPRVLHFGEDFQVFYKSIGMLTRLRCIKMKCIWYTSFKLPSSWANLKNLEFLHISGYGITITIEKNIATKMTSLRHIYINTCKLEVPQGYTTNLQTVRMLKVDDKSDVEKLKGLTGVFKLGIVLSNARIGSILFTHLATLHNLVDLTLSYVDRYENECPALCSLLRITRLRLDGCERMVLPSDFPPNLSYLTLNNMRFNRDPMKVLNRLPELCYLKMDIFYVVEHLVFPRGGFPKLKVLCLDNMLWLKTVEVEEGAVPEIEKLIIHKSSKLKAENLPEHLKHVTTIHD